LTKTFVKMRNINPGAAIVSHPGKAIERNSVARIEQLYVGLHQSALIKTGY